VQDKWRNIGRRFLLQALVLSTVWTGVAAGGMDRAEARTNATVTTAPFTDVSAHWAAKEIAEANKKGLIRGFPDGTFRPEQTISQEEFLVMIERVIPPFTGHEPDEFARETFLSKAKGRWSEETYTHMLAAGITPSGNPTDALDRLEGTRLMLAALGHQSEGEKYRGSNSKFFTDLPIENESQVMTVYPAYKLGIISGFPDGTFRADEKVSRAQAVVLLSRLSGQIEELFPGVVTDEEKQNMTKLISSFMDEVMNEQNIRRFDELVDYVQKEKLPASEQFLREHFSFMKYEVYDYIRFPQFNELIYYAKLGNDKYRMTVQYYSGELGGSIDKTFYFSSTDGKTFRLIGKDE
jgi:S-layer homology domain